MSRNRWTPRSRPDVLRIQHRRDAFALPGVRQKTRLLASHSSDRFPDRQEVATLKGNLARVILRSMGIKQERPPIQREVRTRGQTSPAQDDQGSSAYGKTAKTKSFLNARAI